MKYLVFYNKPAASLYKEIKKGFDLKIIGGINKVYNGVDIKVSYSNQFIEFALGKRMSCVSVPKNRTV